MAVSSSKNVRIVLAKNEIHEVERVTQEERVSYWWTKPELKQMRNEYKEEVMMEGIKSLIRARMEQEEDDPVKIERRVNQIIRQPPHDIAAFLESKPAPKIKFKTNKMLLQPLPNKATAKKKKKDGDATTSAATKQARATAAAKRKKSKTAAAQNQKNKKSKEDSESSSSSSSDSDSDSSSSSSSSDSSSSSTSSSSSSNSSSSSDSSVSSSGSSSSSSSSSSSHDSERDGKNKTPTERPDKPGTDGTTAKAETPASIISVSAPLITTETKHANEARFNEIPKQYTNTTTDEDATSNSKTKDVVIQSQPTPSMKPESSPSSSFKLKTTVIPRSSITTGSPKPTLERNSPAASPTVTIPSKISRPSPKQSQPPLPPRTNKQQSRVPPSSHIIAQPSPTPSPRQSPTPSPRQSPTLPPKQTIAGIRSTSPLRIPSPTVSPAASPLASPAVSPKIHQRTTAPEEVATESPGSRKKVQSGIKRDRAATSATAAVVSSTAATSVATIITSPKMGLLPPALTQADVEVEREEGNGDTPPPTASPKSPRRSPKSPRKGRKSEHGIRRRRKKSSEGRQQPILDAKAKAALGSKFRHAVLVVVAADRLYRNVNWEDKSQSFSESAYLQQHLYDSGNLVDMYLPSDDEMEEEKEEKSERAEIRNAKKGQDVLDDSEHSVEDENTECPVCLGLVKTFQQRKIILVRRTLCKKCYHRYYINRKIDNNNNNSPSSVAAAARVQPALAVKETMSNAEGDNDDVAQPTSPTMKKKGNTRLGLYHRNHNRSLSPKRENLLSSTPDSSPKRSHMRRNPVPSPKRSPAGVKYQKQKKCPAPLPFGNNKTKEVESQGLSAVIDDPDIVFHDDNRTDDLNEVDGTKNSASVLRVRRASESPGRIRARAMRDSTPSPKISAETKIDIDSGKDLDIPSFPKKVPSKSQAALRSSEPDKKLTRLSLGSSLENHSMKVPSKSQYIGILEPKRRIARSSSLGSSIDNHPRGEQKKDKRKSQGSATKASIGAALDNYVGEQDLEIQPASKKVPTKNRYEGHFSVPERKITRSSSVGSSLDNHSGEEAASSRPVLSRKGSRRAMPASRQQSQTDDNDSGQLKSHSNGINAFEHEPTLKIDKDKVKEKIANRRRALQRAQRTGSMRVKDGVLASFLRGEAESVPSTDNGDDDNTIQSAPM